MKENIKPISVSASQKQESQPLDARILQKQQEIEKTKAEAEQYDEQVEKLKEKIQKPDAEIEPLQRHVEQKHLQEHLKELQELLGDNFSLFQESIDKSIDAQEQPLRKKFYFNQSKEELKHCIKQMNRRLSVYKNLKTIDKQEAKTLRANLKEKRKDLKELKELPEKAIEAVPKESIERLLAGQFELKDIKTLNAKEIGDYLVSLIDYHKQKEAEAGKEEEITKMKLLEILQKLEDFDPKKQKPEQLELELLSAISAEEELERIGLLFDESTKGEIAAIQITLKDVRDGRLKLNKQTVAYLENTGYELEQQIQKKQQQLLSNPELAPTTANITAEKIEKLWSREERMKIFEKIQQTRQVLLSILSKPEFVKFLDNEEREKEYAQNIAKMIIEAKKGVGYGEPFARWQTRFRERLSKIENRARSKNIERFCRIAKKLTPAGITAGAVIGMLLAFKSEVLAEWHFDANSLELTESDNNWIVHFERLANVLEITPDHIDHDGNELTQLMDEQDIQGPGVNFEIHDPAGFEAEVFKRAEQVIQELAGKTFSIGGKEFTFKADSLDKISNVGELLMVIQEINNISHEYDYLSLENKVMNAQNNKIPYDIALKNNESLVCRHMAYGYNQMLKLLIEKKLPQFKGIIADEVLTRERLPSGAKGLWHDFGEISIPLNDQEVIVSAIDPTWANVAYHTGDGNWLDDLDAMDSKHSAISSMILAGRKGDLPVIVRSRAKWGEFQLSKEERLNILTALLEANQKVLKADRRVIRNLLFEYYKDTGAMEAQKYQLELMDQEQESSASAGYLSQFYLRNGDFGKALDYVKESVKRITNAPETEQLVAKIRLAQFWRVAYDYGYDNVEDKTDPKNPVVYSKADLLNKAIESFQEIIDSIEANDNITEWLVSAYWRQANNLYEAGNKKAGTNAFDQAFNLAEKNSTKVNIKENIIKLTIKEMEEKESSFLDFQRSAEQRKKSREEMVAIIHKISQQYKETIDLCENPAKKLELINKFFEFCRESYGEAVGDVLDISQEVLGEITHNQFLDLEKRIKIVTKYIDTQSLMSIQGIIRTDTTGKKTLEQDQKALEQKLDSDEISQIVKNAFNTFLELNPLSSQADLDKKELNSQSAEIAQVFMNLSNYYVFSDEHKAYFKTAVLKESKRLEELVQNNQFSKEVYEDEFLVENIKNEIAEAKQLTNQQEKLQKAREILEKGVYDAGKYDDDQKAYQEGKVIKGMIELGLSWREIGERVISQLDDEPEKALPVLLTQLRNTFKRHFQNLNRKEQKSLITKINEYAFNPENDVPYITNMVYRRIHNKDAPRELDLPWGRYTEITLKEWKDYAYDELLKGLPADSADKLKNHFRAEKIRVFTKNLESLIQAAEQQNEVAADELDKRVFNEFKVELESAADNTEKLNVLRDFIKICNETGTYMVLEYLSFEVDPLIQDINNDELDSLYRIVCQETTNKQGNINDNIGTHILRQRVFSMLHKEKSARNLNTGTLYQEWKEANKRILLAPITDINPIKQLREKISYYDWMIDRGLIESQDRAQIEQIREQTIKEWEARLIASPRELYYDDYVKIADYWNEQNKSIPTIKNTIAWLERYALSAGLERVKDNKKIYDIEVKNIEKLVKYLTAGKKGEIGDFLGHLRQLGKKSLEQVGPDIKRLRFFEREIADIPANKPLKDGLREIIELYEQRLGK